MTKMKDYKMDLGGGFIPQEALPLEIITIADQSGSVDVTISVPANSLQGRSGCVLASQSHLLPITIVGVTGDGGDDMNATWTPTRINDTKFSIPYNTGLLGINAPTASSLASGILLSYETEIVSTQDWIPE